MTILLPSLKIKPPEWMYAPELVRILDILNQEDINARMVGGCIRNHFFNKDIYDIDIACIYPPDKTIDICVKAGIKIIPTGIKHGTVTARINNRNFEITTLRQDTETDGRHAKIAYTDNWVLDAKRRDFTINALYADRDGSIYDPLNTGLADLQNNIVRFIGEPLDRIEEDYLRILRFFRFYAEYHHGEPDAASISACYKSKDGLTTLSDERICDELFKLLNTNYAFRSIDLMKDIPLFNILHNAGALLKELIQLQNQLHKQNVSTRYNISINNRIFIKNNKIISFINKLDNFKSQWNGNIASALYHYDRDIVIQGLLTLKAEGKDISDTIIAHAMNDRVPIFPIIANDVMNKLKIKQGPEVGLKLREAENLWIKSGFKLDRSAILNEIKS